MVLKQLVDGDPCKKWPVWELSQREISAVIISTCEYWLKCLNTDVQKGCMKEYEEKRQQNTHILLLVLYSGSMRMPASFSSGLARYDSGGNARRCRKRTWSLLGENERPGVGEASTIALISSGGDWYIPSAPSSTGITYSNISIRWNEITDQKMNVSPFLEDNSRRKCTGSKVHLWRFKRQSNQEQ